MHFKKLDLLEKITGLTASARMTFSYGTCLLRSLTLPRKTQV